MDAKHVLTVLTRIAQRHPEQATKIAYTISRVPKKLSPVAIEVAVETGDPIGQVLAQYLSENPDPAFAAEIRTALSEKAIALREVSYEIHRQILSTFQVVNSSVDSKRDYANLLNDAARSANDLNKTNKAVELLRKAIGIFREISRGQNTSEPGLALSLTHMSMALAKIGDTQASARVAEDAIGCYRELINEDISYRHLLAWALAHYAETLRLLHRYDDAQHAIEESVSLHREIGDAVDSAEQNATHATALFNLSKILRDRGYVAESLSALEEALSSYRMLADRVSDPYRFQVAKILHTLGELHYTLGNRISSMEASEEAIAIARELASERPDQFEDALASMLTELAKRQYREDEFDQSVLTIREAISIRKNLAKARTTMTKWQLSISLHNSVPMFLQVGDLENSLEVAKEAIHLRQTLANADPEEFEVHLAASFNHLALVYLDMNENDRAFEEAQKAVDLLCVSFFRYPEVYADWMESFLYVYLSCLELVPASPDISKLSEIAAAISDLKKNSGREPHREVLAGLHALQKGDWSPGSPFIIPELQD